MAGKKIEYGLKRTPRRPFMVGKVKELGLPPADEAEAMAILEEVKSVSLASKALVDPDTGIAHPSDLLNPLE